MGIPADSRETAPQQAGMGTDPAGPSGGAAAVPRSSGAGGHEPTAAK